MNIGLPLRVIEKNDPRIQPKEVPLAAPDWPKTKPAEAPIPMPGWPTKKPAKVDSD